MRILITGHTGLIGSNLIKRLGTSSPSVLGISKSDGFDLVDYQKLQKTVSEFKPEVVVMLAANAAESQGQISPMDMTQNNMSIFVNTLTASINAGVKKFIYTSSAAVYGEVETPYKENGDTLPKDVYGANKLACEHILKIMARVYGFDYTILRPHNVYGPGQKMDDPYRNVVALFMRKLLEGQPYKLFDGGRMQRQFSYVDNVVDILLTAIETNALVNKTLNIGSNHAISIKQLSDTLRTITGIEVPINYEPARPQEIDMFLADHSLQDSLVKYKDTPLKEGLKKTWDWVKSQEMKPVIIKEREINV